MNFFRLFLCLVISISILVSCGNDTHADPDSISGKDSLAKINGALPVSQDITVKTFVVKDSTGKEKGWGYDLYVDGKKTISQPIIPAVPGNDAFVTEDEAKRIGELAMKKMKSTGSFPTISIHDLDSLGVKHK